MRNIKNKYMAMVLIIIFLFVNPAFIYAADEPQDSLEYLKGIINMIFEKYQGEVDESKLVEGAVKGMFNTLDQYSTYYNNEEVQQFLTGVTGTYEGIGISMEKKGDFVVVLKVFEGSPAESSGILQSDVIISVDGESIAGLTIDKVAAKIKGPAGTKVKLSLLRDKTPLTIEVARAEITLNPVRYEIRDDIGYIKLEMFNSGAYNNFKEALDVMGMQNIARIVLDLRGNPGGEVNQAVEIAKKFVPEGIITTLDFKSELVEDIEYRSPLKRKLYDVVVLVNNNSASASEILAGAIQDTGVGVLVGTNTFGKAQVQNLIPLLTPKAYEKYKKELNVEVVSAYDLIAVYGISPLNSEVLGWTKMTTGIYLTPGGKYIDENGLVPDYEIADPNPVNEVDITNIKRLSKKVFPGLNSSSSEIINAEKILKAGGFDIEIPDNLLDEKTFAAIKKLQTDEGLDSTGILDKKTQAILNEMLDELIIRYDLQYMKAVEILKK